MPAAYDVFLSHAWTDGDRPQQIADALTKAGLRVWFDAAEINDFASITRAVTEGLAKSKALLAYYSKTYPLRRACQWELTAAFLAAQTEGDPRRRVLVVSPEEKADHIHPIELRDAKFLPAPADKAALQALVKSVRKHVDTISGPLPDIRPLTPPLWHGIKPVRYERFVGRFQEMWTIHSSLHETGVVQITGASGQNIAQVAGLGGIGKSLLAREYALRFGDAYPGGIFWLNAYGNDDTRATLSNEGREAERDDQLRRFAQDFGIDVQGRSPDEIRSSLIREIEKHGQPCLWIVDDLPSGLNAKAFDDWCAPHQLARTLITTRSRSYDNLGSTEVLNLEVLPEDDAYQLLVSRRAPLGELEVIEARNIVRELGCHALAVDVAGARLHQDEGVQGFALFREELKAQDEDALELAAELSHELPIGHQRSIAYTMLRSIRALGAEGQEFLRLASVLAVAPIPASLVMAVFEKVEGVKPVMGEQRQRKAFQDVTRASLAEIAGEKQDARSVHTLVSRAMRFHEKAAPESVRVLQTAAIEALRAEIAKAAPDPRLHKQIEFHVAHARQVVAIPATVNQANLVDCVARYDFARGAYATAGMLCERYLEFCRRAQGPEHPTTIIAMNNLAETLRVRGDLQKARRLHEEALALQHRVLGPEDPNTLNSMNNLAATLGAQGDSAGARKLLEETLALQRRVLGSDHPKTLSSMSNLAKTLLYQGDLTGSSQLQEKTLAVRRRVLGAEHPDTLTSMNNLGQTLRAQGDFAGACRLHEEVLATRRGMLGPEHPDTLASMDDLASTLSARGDLAGARKLQEEVFATHSRVLGPEHPATLTSMSNLALTLHDQGEWSRARKLNEEALDIRRRVLGPEHPATLTSMNNLASTLQLMGDLAGARSLQEEALHVVRRVLGPEHPDTLTSMNNLAATLGAQGDSAGACKLLEETLAIQRRVLGPEHPVTLTLMNNLASTLRAQGDLAGARRKFEEIIAIRRRVLGPEHPDTLTSANGLAVTLDELGELVGARKLKEETFRISRDLLGPEHPDTLTSMNNLAATLRAQGDLAGARKLYKDTLVISRRVLGPEHPHTSGSAWNLFKALQDLGERTAARTVFKHDLLWLLDHDPTALDADQRRIREMVARARPVAVGSLSAYFLDATARGDFAMVKALLRDHPKQVLSKDSEGWTPLHRAAQGGRKDVAELLLASGADVGAKTKRGWTPLHVAASGHKKDVAELLLANQADANAKDNFGETPLHLAAVHGHEDLVASLLAAKAEVNAKNNKGHTPMDFATNKNLAELLRQNGGRDSTTTPNADQTASHQ